MFTGIIQMIGTIVGMEGKELIHLRIQTDKSLKGVRIGSSVAVNGVCLTITKIQKNILSFDAMKETLRATNLGALRLKNQVHLEPSAKFGDEIGGHVVSGHISDMATIIKIEKEKENFKMTFQVKPPWMKYIFHKGFLALDGCSLTVNEANRKKGTFAVWLIPETLRSTTFGKKKKGDTVNVEIDAITQAVVETVERLKL